MSDPKRPTKEEALPHTMDAPKPTASNIADWSIVEGFACRQCGDVARQDPLTNRNWVCARCNGSSYSVALNFCPVGGESTAPPKPLTAEDLAEILLEDDDKQIAALLADRDHWKRRAEAAEKELRYHAKYCPENDERRAVIPSRLDDVLDNLQSRVSDLEQKSFDLLAENDKLAKLLSQTVDFTYGELYLTIKAALSEYDRRSH